MYERCQMDPRTVPSGAATARAFSCLSCKQGVAAVVRVLCSLMRTLLSFKELSDGDVFHFPATSFLYRYRSQVTVPIKKEQEADLR